MNNNEMSLLECSRIEYSIPGDRAKSPKESNVYFNVKLNALCIFFHGLKTQRTLFFLPLFLVCHSFWLFFSLCNKTVKYK